MPDSDDYVKLIADAVVALGKVREVGVSPEMEHRIEEMRLALMQELDRFNERKRRPH